MTRKRQKIEERLFAERAIALLGEHWTIREPPNEREWPDLLVDTATGSFGLEVRKLYPDEASGGSAKRAAESLHARRLTEVAVRYYAGGAPPARVQFYGLPPTTLASDLASMVPSMQTWEHKKVTYDSQRWMHVCRLPAELAKYSRWDILTDSIGWVGVIDSSVVQRAIQEKFANLAQHKMHVEDVRLLLACDRTRNSGKLLFGDLPGIEDAGFPHIYLLSFPDQLVQIPAQQGAPASGQTVARPARG
ncbi:MAG: hypothetical protein HYY01_02055 [Chloroflexi bacterium]|nr:hypothetical protein [Chloroflexota bacterium]